MKNDNDNENIKINIATQQLIRTSIITVENINT